MEESMTLHRLTILLSISLLLAACAPRMTTLPQPPKLLVQYGYAFMPPDEPDWKVAGRDGQRLMLGRVGNSRDETLVIMAGNVAIPHFKSRAEFEAYVREKTRSESSPGGRFTVQGEEMHPVRHDGADCLQAHVISIDHEAKKRSHQKGDMTIELLQLTCRHPHDDGTATFLGYSQRAYPESRDPEFMKKGERLLDSLRFSKF